MPAKNLLSNNLTEAQMISIKSAIDQITNTLPFLISLTQTERMGGIKQGDKTIAFVQKAYEYAKNNANLVPAFTSMPEWTKDYELNSKLHSIANILAPLAQKIDDTIMQTGIESLGAALSFYNSTKQAAKTNVPGAKAIYEDLQKRFPGAKKIIQTK